MTCPRCGDPAQRFKNGRKHGVQQWRVQCRNCRRQEQRTAVGRNEARLDRMLRVQLAIDEALGRPW